VKLKVLEMMMEVTNLDFKIVWHVVMIYERRKNKFGNLNV
jgi:hypothetical protein